MYILAPFAILLAALSPSYAQVETDVPIGEQCGGLGWTGSTVCVVGGWCHALTEAYSVCEPIPPTPDPPYTPPTTTYTSVSTKTLTYASCGHWIRDEQQKRWTCAPSPSTTSTTYIEVTSVTPTASPTSTV